VALHQGRLKEARSRLERAIAGQPETRDPWLGAWFPLHAGAFAATFLAWLTWLEGDRDGARRLAEAALSTAAEAGDPFTVCHCLSFDIWMAIWNEEDEHVAGAAEQLKAMAAANGFPLYLADGIVFGGWALMRRGDHEAAARVIGEGTSALEATGARMLQSIFLTFLAEAEWRSGRAVDALAVIDRALQFAETTGERFYEAELHRLHAELLLVAQPDRASEAEASLHHAVGLARRQNAKAFERRAGDDLRRLHVWTR
jgi:tetratricopeptide (TPR) repeat protein